MESELQRLLAGQEYQTEKLEKIDDRLKELNGSVRNHEVRITVMETFCHDQVKPALDTLVNVRMELARWSAFGGVAGVIAAALFGLGKLVGWW